MKILLVTLSLVLSVHACSKGGVQECSVGELGTTAVGGLCNGAKPAESCVAYCKKTYAGDYIAGACTPKRGNGKSECICNIRCISGGALGSGHVWSLKSKARSPNFAYKGIQKTIFVKTTKKINALPQFELRHKNRPHPKNKLAVIPDISELIIESWNVTVEINTPDKPTDKFGLKFNGKPQTIPFRHAIPDDHREHFVDIKFHPKIPHQLVLETSFGKRIVYETIPAGDFSYSDIHVHIPRHPELKNNVNGLLGRFDDDPNEDFFDPAGKKHKVDHKFSWDFGDSWIVPGAGEKTVIQKHRVEIEILHKQVQHRTLPRQRRALINLCKKNTERTEISTCANRIGHLRPSVEQCVHDIIQMEHEKDRQLYLRAVQKKFTVHCQKEIDFKPHIELRDPNVCTVGEYQPGDKDGVCNGNDAAKKHQDCLKFCQQKYGADVLDGRCRDENVEGFSECLCKFKKATAGCLGDPHCFSFDSPVKNPTFDYQGIAKHWMIRPKKGQGFKYLPRFELRQTNHQYLNSAASILDLSELKIIDWNNLKVEINVPDNDKEKFLLKVNGKDEKIPFTWTKMEKYRQDYVLVALNPKSPNQIVLETSFGLRVTIDNHPSPTVRGTYSDIHIDLPRHPDLKGNIEGLLGNFNDNHGDDNIDSTGKPQPLNTGPGQWAFGNSWVVPEGNSKEDAKRYHLEAEKRHEEHMKTIKPDFRKKVEKLCTENFGKRDDLDECSKKIQHYYPSVENCIFDLLVTPEEHHLHIVKAVHNKFTVHCEKKILTRPHPIDPNCAVGELVKTDKDGLCNGKDGNPDEKCAAFCKDKYKTDFIQSSCRGDAGRRECICSIKCGTAGCWGDPHCKTFDKPGVDSFSYQGKNKHWIVKPKQLWKEMINFEVRQTNRPYPLNPVMTLLETQEIVIADWKLTILITAPVNHATPAAYTLQVNGKPEKIPYLFTKTDDYREHFVNIVPDPKVPNVFVLFTSFGLRIRYSTAFATPTCIYSDFSIDLPRHPEVKGNIAGLLGNFNDNPNDDNIDSTGKPQPFDGFSWNFGNSWLVPGNWTPLSLEDERKKAEQKRQAQLQQITARKRQRVEKLCRDNLINHKDFVACAEARKLRFDAVDKCELELLNMQTETDMKHYLKMIHKQFAAHCGTDIETDTDEVCHRKLTPLYRMYNAELEDHFYTVDFAEALEETAKGYKFEKSPGFVSTVDDDCHGREGHKPVYRLFKKGDTPKEADHFYSIDEWEAENYGRNKGYKREGTAFYCSHKPNDCGATVPLYRYQLADEHFYTHDEREGERAKGKFVGIECFIWPGAGSVEQN